VLDHYYLANNKIENFSIASNPLKSQTTNSLIYSIRYIEDLTCVEIDTNDNPYKSISYFTNRYAKHPIYRYRFLGFYIGNVLKTIFVLRKQRVSDICCIRIIDILGEFKSLGNIASNLQSILEQENAEYIR